jgi:hypothetical protein
MLIADFKQLAKRLREICFQLFVEESIEIPWEFG